MRRPRVELFVDEATGRPFYLIPVNGGFERVYVQQRPETAGMVDRRPRAVSRVAGPYSRPSMRDGYDEVLPTPISVPAFGPPQVEALRATLPESVPSPPATSIKASDVVAAAARGDNVGDAIGPAFVAVLTRAAPRDVETVRALVEVARRAGVVARPGIDASELRADLVRRLGGTSADAGRASTTFARKVSGVLVPAMIEAGRASRRVSRSGADRSVSGGVDLAGMLAGMRVSSSRRR